MKRVLVIMAALAAALLVVATGSGFRSTTTIARVVPATAAPAKAGGPTTARGKAAATACNPTSVQQTLGVNYAPAGTGPGATTNGHKEDFYVPQGPGASCNNLPVIIYSEGSAWTSDNGRSFPAALRDKATAAGFAIVGMSIRSSSQA
jgi:acetyl esterase/lipase